MSRKKPARTWERGGECSLVDPAGFGLEATLFILPVPLERLSHLIGNQLKRKTLAQEMIEEALGPGGRDAPHYFRVFDLDQSVQAGGYFGQDDTSRYEPKLR